MGGLSIQWSGAFHFCARVASPGAMRTLTDDELKIFFEKLANYIGRNIKLLIDRKDEPFVFRVHKDRVYYLSENLLRFAAVVGKKELVAAGVCFGKFTKSKKFKLHVTALPVIAPLAKFKVWVKPSSELCFCYGNHLLKAGLAPMSDNCPQYQGVIVYSMSDVPLGFGATARGTTDARKLDPTEIVVFHQADVGEYLRLESSLF